MTTYYYTPDKATFDWPLTPLEDMQYVGTYNFKGIPILSMQFSAGLNKQASVAQLTLVDPLGTVFNDTTLTIGKIYGFSLPQQDDIDNGVTSYFPSTGTLIDFGPDAPVSDLDDWPAYFAGVCTSWEKDEKNISGKTIRINLSDAREIIDGVQVICGDYALSQEVGYGSAGNRLQTGIKNIVDAFGYQDKGLSADFNEYGLAWSGIRQCLENIKVTMYGSSYEFKFEESSCWTDTPEWYRINADIIPLLDLVGKVAEDGGCDFYAETYKVSDTGCLVKFKQIKRNLENANDDDLTAWINDGSTIQYNTTSFSRGVEFRNEDNAKILLGSKKENFVRCIPHQITVGEADLEELVTGANGRKVALWEKDVYQRLYVDNTEATLYPYFGFGPSGNPLARPFLDLRGVLTSREIADIIPHCDIYPVDVSYGAPIPQNGDSYAFAIDDCVVTTRPVDYASDPTYDDITDPTGVVWEGFPMTTDMMQAALQGIDAFSNELQHTWPTIAGRLGFQAYGFPIASISGFLEANDNKFIPSPIRFLRKERNYISPEMSVYYKHPIAASQLHKEIYNRASAYASEYLGLKWYAVLPKSEIMERIFAGQSVPTQTFDPHIEYETDQAAFLPSGNTPWYGWLSDDFVEQYDSTEYRFKHNDNKYECVVKVDYLPSGVNEYQADGLHVAMFGDIPMNDYRPHFALADYDFEIFLSASVEQMIRRPDIAVVSISSPVMLDTNDWATPYPVYSTVVQLKKIFPDIGKGNLLWLANQYNLSKTLSLEKWSSIPANSIRNMDISAAYIPLRSNMQRYGPWALSSADGFVGKSSIEVDDTLSPWNFASSGLMDSAAFERLLATASPDKEITKASANILGFPRIKPFTKLGKNSYVSSISTNFGIDGISTDYGINTYTALPGTFRKSEFDDLSKLTHPEKIFVSMSNVSDMKPWQQSTNRFRPPWAGNTSRRDGV